MAAQIAAFGGLIYPLLRGFVAPHLFGFEVSTKAVVMSLVGGVGTLLGPLVGSVIITFLESFVGSYTERHLLVLGVIFIVFVMFLPDGLCGLARRLLASRRKAEHMIKVTDLSKAFGGLRAVDHLSFEAQPHRITSIIGPNGAGKSTAFNLIAGTLRPDAGKVELDGRDITGERALRPGRARRGAVVPDHQSVLRSERLRERAARLPEPGAAQPLSRPAGSAVRAAGRAPRSCSRNSAFGTTQTSWSAISRTATSAGSRSRSAWRSQPKLLMLDEPTQGMSPSETAEIDALIKSLAGRVTVLLIEHDIELVMSLSDHVVVMHQGQKLFEGAPEAVRASTLVREAYLGVDHAAA